MNINFHTPHIHLDSNLQEYVSDRLNHLIHYDNSITDVDIYFKLDNNSNHIKNMIVEIKCHVPHHTYFVEYVSDSFEESFDHSYKSLVTKLVKEKDRLKSL